MFFFSSPEVEPQPQVEKVETTPTKVKLSFFLMINNKSYNLYIFVEIDGREKSCRS